MVILSSVLLKPAYIACAVGGALYVSCRCHDRCKKASANGAAVVSEYIGYLEKGQIPPKVLFQGGQVVSWKNERREEMLFRSNKHNVNILRMSNFPVYTYVAISASVTLWIAFATLWKPPKAIRGGIPISFPQFGTFGSLERHAFARNRVWSLDSSPSPLPAANSDHRALKKLRRILRLLMSLKVVSVLPAPARDPTPLSLLPFGRLKVLELRGCELSTSAARGLLELRHTLEKLICHNSTDALKHVFASRIADIKNSPHWNRLSFISFARNGLVLMDDSLQLIPAVETLDLSRNKFTKVNNLWKCTKLKHLDLGFNQLRNIA
ncbi:hypothetical protein BC332_17549 [Capsicum chinense]|nr:hypothetical protein BC332_17549 [Capsicum chinense]